MHKENVRYCRATRVRNGIYCETANALQCTGAGNEFPLAKCMAAVNVFAGQCIVAILTETVRALCNLLSVLEELLPVSKEQMLP